MEYNYQGNKYYNIITSHKLFEPFKRSWDLSVKCEISTGFSEGDKSIVVFIVSRQSDDSEIVELLLDLVVQCILEF